MRILHIDPDDIDNPLSGGGPVRTFEICRRLARRHEVTVLTPTFPGSTPEVVRDGVRYIRLGRKVGNHGSSHHFTFLASLPWAVRHFEYDLLVEDFMPPSSVTWTPLFKRNKPLIASVQWFFAREWTRQYKLPFHWGEEYGLRLYRNYVVLTEQMKQFVQQRNPTARCVVLPNGVPEDLFDIKPQTGNFILYLGRIEVHAKGLDLLLEAYARLPEDARIPLLIAGGGFEQAAFAQLIEKYELGGHVKLLGKVGSEQRAVLFRDCRFAVVPSRIETFGMTILEACAAGKPVLTFDHGPMNEVAPPACPGVKAFDAEALSSSMLDYLRRPAEELLRVGAECRIWARRYDWSTIASAQEDFYLATARHWTEAKSGCGNNPPLPPNVP
jgi:glycosyltransferase involved in cell wall biosynthesis